jgi:hypothetical protein
VNWIELMLPVQVRRRVRDFRRLRFDLTGVVIDRRLRLQRSGLGRLLPLRRYADLVDFLDQHGLSARVQWRKQQVLSARCGRQFLRYATRPKGMRIIEAEYGNWLLLKAADLGHIAPRTMRLTRLGGGLVLTTDVLETIPRDSDEATAALDRVIRALIARCGQVVPGLPPSVAEGLTLARHLAGGSLPAWLGPEEEIRAAFERPLRVGFFHGDLHSRNVMRNEDGRPVLVDLKSCGPERIVALDLLRLAVGRYPDDLRTGPVGKIAKAEAAGWDLPAVQPFLQHIDLPAKLWGRAYALHVLGSVAGKPSRRSGGVRNPRQNPLLGAMLARLIAA